MKDFIRKHKYFMISSTLKLSLILFGLYHTVYCIMERKIGFSIMWGITVGSMIAVYTYELIYYIRKNKDE